MAQKGMLPRQAWDEINVSHDRVKTPQVVNVIVKAPKQKKQKKGKKK